MKRLLKYFSALALSGLVSAFLLVLFTQTPLFKNWLRDRLVSLAKERLNLTVELEKLRGTLITYVQLEGLSVRSAGKPLLRAKRLYLRYGPLGLLLKQVTLRQVILEEPELNLEQAADGTWNLQSLTDRFVSDAADSSSEPLIEWTVVAPAVAIESGSLRIVQRQQQQLRLPSRVRNFDMEFGLWLRRGSTRVSLRQLRFETEEPAFAVETRETEFRSDAERLQMQHLNVRTHGSNVTSSLDLRRREKPSVDFSLRGDPIALSEVRDVVPTLRIYGNPRLDLEASGPLQDLALRCDLLLAGGKIELTGRLQAWTRPFRYELRGRVANFNLAELTLEAGHQSDLNLQFHLAGTGHDLAQAAAELTVRVDSSRVGQRVIDFARLESRLHRGTVDYDLRVGALGGSARATGSVVANLDSLAYSARVEFQHLNLARFLESASLRTDLNAVVAMRGKGINPRTATATLLARLQPSSVNRVPIDRAEFDVGLKQGTVRIRSLRLYSELGECFARGALSFEQASHLQLEANLTDFSMLTRAFPIDSLTGWGKIVARLDGPPDSLHLAADFDLQNLTVGETRLARFRGKGEGVYAVSRRTLALQGTAAGLRAYRFRGDSLAFRLSAVDTTLDFVLHRASGKDVSAKISGRAVFANEKVALDVRDLEIVLRQETWRKADTETRIQVVQNGRVEISGLTLLSDAQQVSLDGVLNPDGQNNLALKLANIDLARQAQLLLPEVHVSGRGGFDLTLTGTLAEPELAGSMEVAAGRYLDVPFERFAGTFRYAQEQVSWVYLLSKTQSDSALQTSGHLPLRLSLSPFEMVLLRDQPLELKLSTRSLDIAFLQAFATGIRDIRGTLVADIVLRNTLRDLRGVGPIRLINGGFAIPELGTRYEKINLLVVLDDRRIDIRDFRVHSGGGLLELVDGSLSLSEDTVEEFNAHLKMKDFQVMNNRKIQARAKGKIEVSGSIQAPYVSGEVTVNQARMYYPAWFENDTAVELSSQPFFIISEDTARVDTAGAMRFQKRKKLVEQRFTESAFYKNIRGELAVYFPRNAWLRSEDANIEIEGELVAVKEGPEITLFGSCSTIRGFYELFGNRFQIQEGELVFNGDPDYNPEVSIDAVYTFRDLATRETHKFKVVVSGTLFYPEFRFLLDGQEARQEDVLSILLFGQSFDNLSIGQKSGISQKSSLNEEATGLLTGQVLSHLTSELGKELNLDVVQIESGQGLADTKVRIGKYVTPDVFVSVSQDFGAEGNRRVELEYEIPKKILFFKLLLQAVQERKGNTGLDVIWKIEW